MVEIPPWAVGVIISFVVTIVGALIAQTRASTRVATTVEILSSTVREMRSDFAQLTKNVGDLSADIRSIYTHVDRLPNMESSIRELEENVQLMEHELGVKKRSR